MKTVSQHSGGNAHRASRGIRLSLVVIVLGLVIYRGTEGRARPLSGAGIHQADENERSQLHGRPEVLAELMLRERGSEVALKTIQGIRGPGLTAAEIDALQTVFQSPFDTLQVNTETGGSSLPRRVALAAIRSTSVESQRQWVAANDVEAELALRQASTIDEYFRVSRHFPMTTHGLRAGQTAVRLCLLEGRAHYARLRWNILRDEYERTALEREFSQLSSQLIPKFQASSQAPASATRASMDDQSHATNISPVWPKPRWEWKELLETFPGAPQPQTSSELTPLVHHSYTSLDDFNNWQPVLWNGCILHRTPLRIVAIDQQTGQERWLLPTDTIEKPLATESNRESRRRSRFLGIEQGLKQSTLICDSIAFGMMSADDEYLYFLDGIPLISTEDGDSHVDVNDLFPPLVPTRSQSGASRLVAVRLDRPNAVDRDGSGEGQTDAKDSLPAIAWSVGSDDPLTLDFVYRFALSVDELEENPTSIDPALLFDRKRRRANATATLPRLSRRARDRAGERGADDSESAGLRQSTLNEHTFLSSPIGRGDQLFVLSAFRGQLYVTSLLRHTGHIAWQQPLIYGSASFRSRVNGRESNDPGVCILCGSTLVCCLPDGVILGVRPEDGQIQWATAYSDFDAVVDFNSLQWTRESSQDLRPQRVGVTAGTSDIVVCLHTTSDSIVGLDPATGRIQWKVSRTVVGSLDVNGETDRFVVGIDEAQVVLQGDEHCRSLDIRTGAQLWATRVPESSGRSEMRGDRCLIPQQDGHLLTIDLKDGSLNQIRDTFLPGNSVAPWGAIVSSETQVFAVTPVSVSAFPRSDAILRDQKAMEEISDRNPALTQAQLLLLNHQELEALQVMESEVTRMAEVSRMSEASVENSNASATSSAELPTGITVEDNVAEDRIALHRTLAELILQRWADLYVMAVQQSRTIDGFGASTSVSATGNLSSGEPLDHASALALNPVSAEMQAALATFGSSEEALLLAELDLTSEQQLRSAILSLLSRPSFQLDEADLLELSGFPEWATVLPLTDDWSVRPDLLLSRLTPRPSTLPVDVGALPIAICLRLAEQAVLFPAMLTNEQSAEELVARLINFREFAAAEITLLAWQRQTASNRPKELLADLRQLDDTLWERLSRERFSPEQSSPEQSSPEQPGQEQVGRGRAGGINGQTPVATSNPIGITSETIRNRLIQIRATQSLVTSVPTVLPDPESLRQLSVQALPRWSKCRATLIYSDIDEASLQLTTLSDANVIARLPLGIDLDFFPQIFTHVADGETSPGLLPIAGRTEIAMMSCTVPGQTSVLWKRPAARRKDSRSVAEEIEFGSLGSEHFIWHSGDELHCTHPLTGRDLWVRRLLLRHRDAYLPGRRRIYGDQDVTIVMNDKGDAFERLRTRDGQQLGIGKLDLADDDEVATTGRFLLYYDSKSQLHLFDGLTGQDALASEPPIFRSTYAMSHYFKVLSNGRVLTISRDQELVMIDTMQGRSLFRIPLTRHLSNNAVYGFSAFEQNGMLLVTVEDQLELNQRDRMVYGDERERLVHGVLLRVDADSGTILWERRMDKQIFPAMHGDPTDILVSLQDLSYTGLDDEVRLGLTRITLTDGTTGGELAEKSVSTRLPPRLTHFASEEMFELTSAQTVTRITLETGPARPSGGSSDSEDDSETGPVPDGGSEIEQQKAD